MMTKMIVLLVAVVALAAGMAGCAGAPGPKGVSMQMRLASDDRQAGFTSMQLPEENRRIYVSPEVTLDENDVKDAQVVQMLKGPAVGVQFTRAGAKKLRQFTEEHPEERVAIIVDGRLRVAPPMVSPIRDGKMLIVGGFDMAEAQRLANALSGRQTPVIQFQPR